MASNNNCAYSSAQPETTGRVLHVVYTSGWLTKLQVLESDKTTALYECDTNRLKRPDMIMRSGADNSEMGTVKIHLFKSRIETYVHGQHIPLNSGGMLKGSYSFTSPAFQNATLTWQPRRKMDPLDMVLLDDQAMPVARFLKGEYYGLKKAAGQIELLGNSAGNQAMMDEIVVTALAILQLRQIQMRGALG